MVIRPRIALAFVLCGSALGCGSTFNTAAVSNPPASVTPAPAPTPSPTPTPNPVPTPVPTPTPPPTATATVWTQTNDPGANAILSFSRAADGSLTQAGSTLTGGKGSGGGLENQGSVALSPDGTLLFATNYQTNDFSVFRVTSTGLTLASRASSGGTSPISIAVAPGIAYVLNAGTPNNIAGFRVAADGTTTAIPNGTRPLSGSATTPAQVALAPDGSLAIVTERGTNLVDTFSLDAVTGAAGPVTRNASSGSLPFGFQFLDSTHVFISEEGSNSVSSYTTAGGVTHPVTRAAPNFQAATCWLAIAPSGGLLFTTNTSSGSVSAFSIAADGSTALIGSSGVAARASGAPIDAIVSADSRFLYVVDAGEGIDTFAIAPSGALTLVQNLRLSGIALNGIVSL